MTNELIPNTVELATYQVMAKTAFQSKFFDKMGGESGILSLMLMARELGLSPMQAIMGGLNIIQGKIEVSPRMMNTMIRKAGHKLEIIQNDDVVCKIKGTRHDTKEEYIACFSMDDARRAGLVKSGSGWEKYSSDMLFARCISRLSRRLFADVISTAYVEEEIDRDHSDDTENKSAKVTMSTGEIQTIEVRHPDRHADSQIDSLIPIEEAYTLDRDINLLIHPVDPEYKSRALGVLKIDSFEKLPMSQLARVKANMAKKIDELKKQELGEDDENKVPF